MTYLGYFSEWVNSVVVYISESRGIIWCENIVVFTARAGTLRWTLSSWRSHAPRTCSCCLPLCLQPSRPPATPRQIQTVLEHALVLSSSNSVYYNFIVLVSVTSSILWGKHLYGHRYSFLDKNCTSTIHPLGSQLKVASKGPSLGQLKNTMFWDQANIF